MKRYIVWLKLEWKRIIKRLPAMVIGAIILITIIGMIAFYVKESRSSSAPAEKMKIAIVSLEGSDLTKMLLAFLGNMESLKNQCDFMETDMQTARKMLEAREAVAIIVLPEHMVESILNGSNIPARLYLAADMPAAALLLEEIVGAGISMLQIAQAQIYTVGELYAYYEKEGNLYDIYSDINLYNLELVLNRESLFKTRSLSVTGSQTLEIYYSAAMITILILLSGLSMGSTLIQSQERNCMLAVAGLWTPARVIGEGGILAAVIGLGSLPFVVLAIYLNRSTISVNAVHIVGMIAVFLCVAFLLQLVYSVMRSLKGVFLIWGTLIIGMGFLSGCFIPLILIGPGVERLSHFLPLTDMRQIWGCLFQGKTEGLWIHIGKLMIYTAIFFLINLIVRIRGEARG